MSGKNELKSRQNKASRSAVRRPYLVVSYLSVALFVGLIAYMLFFQFAKSEDLLNSPLNKRQDEVEAQVVRGSIVDRDGVSLAYSEAGPEGNAVRRYPYGGLFAHTIGYSLYGGSGLESAHNNDLIHSHQKLSTQVQNELEREKKPGDSLITTLDVDLQQACLDALYGMQGTVVVMEVDTGKVLANASSPAFDPNTVEEDWEWLTQDERGIFLNRALQGLYPPGSTFKIVTALAYLRQYGSFDGFYYECSGSYTYGDFTIHCANGRVHGYESLADAMAMSCNCAFASMAIEKIDPAQLRKAAEDLGFNADLKCDLPFATSLFSLEEKTVDPLTMQTAIGQGDTLATPMLMCMIAQAVANDGKMLLPQYVERIESVDGNVVKQYSPSSYGQVMTEKEAAQIRDLLRGVVTYGTASDLADLPYEIYGKTGTAEYGEIADGRAHSWFIGFSNTGGNDIVVCALVEDGGDGTLYGSQVARTAFQTYFALRGI